MWPISDQLLWQYRLNRITLPTKIHIIFSTALLRVFYQQRFLAQFRRSSALDTFQSRFFYRFSRVPEYEIISIPRESGENNTKKCQALIISRVKERPCVWTFIWKLETMLREKERGVNGTHTKKCSDTAPNTRVLVVFQEFLVFAITFSNKAEFATNRTPAFFGRF